MYQYSFWVLLRATFEACPGIGLQPTLGELHRSENDRRIFTMKRPLPQRRVSRPHCSPRYSNLHKHHTMRQARKGQSGRASLANNIQRTFKQCTNVSTISNQSIVPGAFTCVLTRNRSKCSLRCNQLSGNISCPELHRTFMCLCYGDRVWRKQVRERVGTPSAGQQNDIFIYTTTKVGKKNWYTKHNEHATVTFHPSCFRGRNNQTLP